MSIDVNLIVKRNNEKIRDIDLYGLKNEIKLHLRSKHGEALCGYYKTDIDELKYLLNDQNIKINWQSYELEMVCKDYNDQDVDIGFECF